jgi:hypothetical protein
VADLSELGEPGTAARFEPISLCDESTVVTEYELTVKSAESAYFFERYAGIS